MKRPARVVFTASIARRGGQYGVEVPARVTAALGARGRTPVVVAVEGGAPFNATLLPRRDGGHWLNVAATARGQRRAGKVSIAIELGDAHREVAVPDDLARALDNANARAGWDALPPGKREHIVAYVEQAAREETRAKRVVLAVERAAARADRRAEKLAGWKPGQSRGSVPRS